MLAVVEDSAAQWSDAFSAAGRVELPALDGVRGVVVCGMGGSGVAGDVLAALAATRAGVPVVVVKGFDLPRWVGEDALAICVSYSGDTEEALACFDVARHRDARLIAVASGGALAARAEEHEVPLLRVPAGMQPRAAMPSLAASVLVAGAAAGLVPDLDDEISAATDAVREGVARWGSAAPGNEAKAIAARVAGGAPRVWGQEGVLAVAAMRWKTQFNENAKMHASWAVLPESLHNELVPGGPDVMLRAPVERERVAARIAAVGGDPLEARAIGTSDLAVLASAALLGDLVSVYCAALLERDPTPVDPITRLKAALR